MSEVMNTVVQTLGSWWAYLQTQHINEMTHILVALFLGFLIGLERRSRHKSAGVKTYMVISGSAALLTLAGVLTYETFKVGDPLRVAAQILASIGFLGAGVILVRGFASAGITTAAMIILAVGAGIGSGVGLHVFTTAAVITILLAVTFASRYFGSNEYAQPVTVICKVDKAEEVRLLFGRHALMGGWDRSVGTDVIEFTIQPELTPHECEALLERLMDNPAIIKATVKNLD